MDIRVTEAVSTVIAGIIVVSKRDNIPDIRSKTNQNILRCRMLVHL